MKKIGIITLMIFFLATFVSCSQESDETTIYLLRYNNGLNNIISTTNESGVFYVLEEPTKKNISFGTVEIFGCYYDGFAINLCIYLNTEDIDLIEQKANDEKHSLYPSLMINQKELELTSYGYSKVEKNTQSDGTRYKILASYSCTEKSINEPVCLSFGDDVLNIPLVEKKGYSQYSTEGQILLKEYSNTWVVSQTDTIA